MTSPLLGDSWVARGGLVVTIACLYAGSVLLNNQNKGTLTSSIP